MTSEVASNSRRTVQYQAGYLPSVVAVITTVRFYVQNIRSLLGLLLATLVRGTRQVQYQGTVYRAHPLGANNQQQHR